MNRLAPLGGLAQDLSVEEVGRRRLGPPRWPDQNPARPFALVTAVNGAVIWQDEFPATSAGVSRAAACVARRTGPPDDVLVVVKGIGSYGAGVARAFARAGYRVAEAGAQPRGDLRGKGNSPWRRERISGP